MRVVQNSELLEIRELYRGTNKTKHGRILVIVETHYGKTFQNKTFAVQYWTAEMINKKKEINADGSISYYIDRL